MKRVLSISHLILPLLAFAFAHSLSAQALVIDKATLAFSGQVGGSAVSQTLNVTSSTGAPINFTLASNVAWLKLNGQPFGTVGTTPAAVTVTADPTGLSVGPYPASIIVMGGSANNNSIAVTFTVSAIGVTPASLAFNYTAGSIPPPGQVLNLTGAATSCTASVAYISGGSWFNLQQTSCASPGTLMVLINSAVVAGLAPNNTYSGTVTVTPTSGGPGVVVQITLTVLPTPQVSVDPRSITFNWLKGSSALNPSQVLTVSTTGAQPLNYAFTQTGVLTGISTLTPSANGSTSSTTGTGQVTYSVNPSGLDVGTYTSQLTLNTTDGIPAQTPIPVTLVVSNSPLLNVPNAKLNFTSQLNATPAKQTVNITSTGARINYSVPRIDYNPSAFSSWLMVPTAWDTDSQFPVSVNPVGLPVGTYSATINVLSGVPGTSATQPIPVELKVTNDPTISASVTELKFPYQIGQANPVAPRNVKLTSVTGAALSYTASLSTTSCGSAWLLLNGAANSVSGVTPPTDTFTVSVATAGLTSATTCTGKITINATNPSNGAAAAGSPLYIDVTLFVSTTPQVVLTPSDPLVFTSSVGVQPPPSQSIGLTSTSTDVLTYSVVAQADNNGNWLFASLQSSTNISLVVFVNPSGLGPNTYTGKVTLTATGPGGAAVANSPVIIPVTFKVTAGSLTLSASDLSFEQTSGGAAPASQTVTIGSNGQTLNYIAAAVSNNAINWLSVSPASGNTATSGVVTIGVDGSKLTPGITYTGSVLVTAPGAGNSPATINVKLKLNSGTISAPNATLSFIQVAGGPAPASQSIAVTGSPAALSFTVTSSTANNVNWLSATPASGTTPTQVQVLVNGTVLAVGQYTGKVTIASPGAGGSPIDVPVVLNVVAPAVLAASPTSLAFAYTVGQAAPAVQNVQVTATGTAATVPLAAQVQFDGTVGQWLVVTPTTSNAPATFAVSVSTTNLTPGTYNGRVVITSTNALAGATIPVTLTVTAIPQPVIRSVNNAGSYATGAVSPGENIVIFGTGVGPAALVSATPASDAYPNVLANTRVLFDNVAAPILYASGGQTSVMVPYGVAGRSTTTIVVEYSGVQSAPLTQTVALAAPGIYTLNQQGTGPGAILNQDGLTVNGSNAPEKRGNVISIYMTGEGQTNPQGVDGTVIPPILSALKRPQQQVTVTIGGVDAPVAYAGSAAGLISGVMQVNVTIPLTAPTGTQPLVVTVGTAKSQSGAGAATVAISQ